MKTTWEEVPLFDMPAIPITPSSAVQEVFDFWLEELRFSSKTRTFLSDKRRHKIEQAIKKYGLQTCKDAILGCKMSEFHMGHNGRGRKYDDIALILRDSEHVEDFANNYHDNSDRSI